MSAPDGRRVRHGGTSPDSPIEGLLWSAHCISVKLLIRDTTGDLHYLTRCDYEQAGFHFLCGSFGNDFG